MRSNQRLLLVPVVIALAMLTRRVRGRPVFTERDWLFLTGRPREKVFSLHLWLRFAVLWIAVVLIGFVEENLSSYHRDIQVGGNDYGAYPKKRTPR